MNLIFAWILIIVLSIIILGMVIYGIVWLVANIQLHFIDKESNNFAVICGYIYMCMNSVQREFIDSNLLNDAEIEIVTEDSKFEDMSLEERSNKIMSLFEDLKFYYDKYQKKVSKSCVFVKLMIGDEFRYYSDVFETFSKAIKIS